MSLKALAQGIDIHFVAPNFVDGTVTGTDLKPYLDADYRNDHSYFGNGCMLSETEGGAYSSPTACATKLRPNRENTEQQFIGTYYNYQGATSGSGATAKTDNTIVPDSFCPLGWQMPYDGTGGDYYNASKSWKNVFGTYGYENNVNSNPNINQYPFDIITAGHFGWHTGSFFVMDDSGLYYSSTVKQNDKAYWIYTYRDHFTFMNGLKADGYNVRWGYFFRPGT